MVIYFSLICRLYDGMPLAVDTDTGPEVTDEWKAAAVTICRQLAQEPRIARDSPALIVAETPYVYFVLCCDDVSCLALCDVTAAPTAAFNYLDEIFTEFMDLYAARLQLATRPYCFLSFDVCLQRTKALYTSTGSVVKRMPARVAAMPPPRRATMEELIGVSPKRRGSGVLQPAAGTPTAEVEPSSRRRHSRTQIGREPMDEFVPSDANREPLLDEIMELARARWKLLALSSCSVCVVTVFLFFLIAYLFE